MEPDNNLSKANGSNRFESEAVATVNSQNTTSYQALLIYTIVALAIAIIVRFFIAAPYIVSGASMDPTFESWHYLIIDRVSYHFEEPERGDVVVFRFPQDPSRSFIKRVIGLPGETVRISGTDVNIINTQYPDGFLLDEPYVSEENYRPSNMTVELGPEEYFVLGDNRRASADSRVWGSLPREFFTGRVFLRLFPLGEISVFPGEARYEAHIGAQ